MLLHQISLYVDVLTFASGITSLVFLSDCVWSALSRGGPRVRTVPAVTRGL